MNCSNCTVNNLLFEFRFEGSENESMLGEVTEHLKRGGWEIGRKEDGFTTGEGGAREFWDFCLHHMDASAVFFQMDGATWRPLAEIEEIFEAQWIDDVIRNERIFCHYQPILSADSAIYGYELLARFTAEDGTLIYPNEIFSAARSRGRLYALDRACRMTAVRHAARLENAKAFINFIPTSIYSPEHCLRSTIELSISLDVNPAQLIFEVVETEQVEDLDHLKRILVYYKERGFNYALDDVGEGYSTMQVLAELTPDYMKLDMQYVQGIAEDKEKQRIALKFLEKAKEVGAVPLAEGIEEVADFDWLKKEGYELFQGYYFGKPAEEPLSA